MWHRAAYAWKIGKISIFVLTCAAKGSVRLEDRKGFNIIVEWHRAAYSLIGKVSITVLRSVAQGSVQLEDRKGFNISVEKCGKGQRTP